MCNVRCLLASIDVLAMMMIHAHWMRSNVQLFLTSIPWKSSKRSEPVGRPTAPEPEFSMKSTSKARIAKMMRYYDVDKGSAKAGYQYSCSLPRQ